MRTNLYALVHKAQRHHLFTFASELGRADLRDPQVQAHIGRGVRDIAELLADHAQNEERYIHPLFTAAGAVGDSLHHEHEELERQLAAWVALVDDGRWSDLYPATMRLIGVYLLHIDGEERAQAEFLWPRYTDAELNAVMTRFKAERDPTSARKDLELFIPALSVPELVGLFAGLRAAPEPVRRAAMSFAQRTLGPGRWAALEQML